MSDVTIETANRINILGSPKCNFLWISSTTYSNRWSISLEVKPEGTDNKIELKARDDSLADAVNKVYSDYCRLLDRMPEYDPNKSLEHHTLNASANNDEDEKGYPEPPEPAPVGFDDEIPF